MGSDDLVYIETNTRLMLWLFLETLMACAHSWWIADLHSRYHLIQELGRLRWNSALFWSSVSWCLNVYGLLFVSIIYPVLKHLSICHCRRLHSETTDCPHSVSAAASALWSPRGNNCEWRSSGLRGSARGQLRKQEVERILTQTLLYMTSPYVSSFAPVACRGFDQSKIDVSPAAVLLPFLLKRAINALWDLITRSFFKL